MAFLECYRTRACDNASIGTTYYEHEMQLNADGCMRSIGFKAHAAFSKCTKTTRPPMCCAKVLLFVQHAIRSRPTCYTYRKAKVKCNSHFTTFIGTERLFHSAAILSAFIYTPRSLQCTHTARAIECLRTADKEPNPEQFNQRANPRCALLSVVRPAQRLDAARNV